MTEEEEVKECFAQYGALVFTAQKIEKSLIVLGINVENITRDRFDELFYERSQMTFGILKEKIESTNKFTEEELQQLDQFNELRNFLVHSFWWDNAIEFHLNHKRKHIFAELERVNIFFSFIDELVDRKSEQIITQYNLDILQIESELLANGYTPVTEVFRKLRKDETLINVQRYKLSDFSTIPIFTLEDGTYWTVSESGLSQYKKDIDFSKVEDIDKLNGIFPVKQFKPRPKKTTDWHYDLLLKVRGLQICIRPRKKMGTVAFQWFIDTNYA